MKKYSSLQEFHKRSNVVEASNSSVYLDEEIEEEDFTVLSLYLSIADVLGQLEEAKRVEKLEEWQEIFASEKQTELGEFMDVFTSLAQCEDLYANDNHQTLQDLFDVVDLPKELLLVVGQELIRA